MTAPSSLAELAAEIAVAVRVAPDAIGVDDNLADWGLDSIRTMVLVERWNRDGLGLTFAELGERPELGYWWSLIASRRAAPPKSP